MKTLNYLLRAALLVVMLGFNNLLLAQETTQIDGKKKSSSCEVTSGTDLASVMAGVCQKACAVQSYDPKDVVDQSTAKAGDLTRCPVSGVVFKVTENSAVVSHEDKELFTCCSTCAGIFDKDPERFL